MITQDILDYITAQRAAGHSEEAVRTALVASGWNVADIDEALSKAPQPVAEPKTAPAEPAAEATSPGAKRAFPWVLLILIFLIFAVIGGGVWFYFSQPASSSTVTQSTATPAK